MIDSNLNLIQNKKNSFKNSNSSPVILIKSTAEIFIIYLMDIEDDNKLWDDKSLENAFYEKSFIENLLPVLFPPILFGELIYRYHKAFFCGIFFHKL